METDNNGLDTNMDIISTDDSGGPVAVVTEGARMGPSMISTLGAASSMPPIGNMSVYKSKLHYGPKIVSVSVTNNEVVKDIVLGRDPETLKPARNCHDSIIVSVCIATVLVCGISVLTLTLKTTQHYRIDIGLNETWYLRRAEWNAMPAYEIEYMAPPVKFVIFGHSGGNDNYCNDRDQCIEKVNHIQEMNLPTLLDVASSYLVGGSGYVFEGRGANVVSAMVKSWNRKSITIMFIGNYNGDKMDDCQVEHVRMLLDVLVSTGVLVRDYELLGQCQIQPYTEPPGYYVMARIGEFPHWNPDKADKCLGSSTS